MNVEIKKAWNGHAKGARVEISDEEFDPTVHTAIVDAQDTADAVDKVSASSEVLRTNERGKLVVKDQYAPKVTHIIGELIMVSNPLETDGRNYRMVTVEGHDAFPVNEKFYASNIAMFETGTFRKFSFQMTEAGKTYYVRDGEAFAHTTTGRSLVSVTPSTRVEALARFGALIPEDASASRQSALATLFSVAVAKA